MKLAVAAGTLRGAGSSLVGQQVLAHLVRDNPGDSFIAWVPPDWTLTANWMGATSPGANVAIKHGRQGVCGKLASELYDIPTTCRREGAVTLFSMGDTGAPRPGLPHLLMVQQAFLAAPSDQFDFSMDANFSCKVRAMAAYFALGRPGITRFTVQTQFMKRWLAQRWEIELALIDVTPSAPGPEVLGRRCQPNDDPVPQVVYLSSAGPHKNHAIVPRVARELRAGGSPVRFILTVRASDLPAVVGDAERLGVSDLIQFRGPVSRAEAINLLVRASAHFVPSRLESFGLGVLEAMAVGCPVVASDREYARELCGNAGLYADADDPLGFASHLAAIIGPRTYWDERSAAASNRYRQLGFDWQAIAASYRRQLTEITE